MKKALLASTALVGAALLTGGPAAAGTVGTGDNFDVSLGAFFRFGLYLEDHDLMTGRGRGYNIGHGEGEVHVRVSKKGENGLLYGFQVEISSLPDDAAVGDETWMFIDSDQWGRIELGDQDGAFNRMGIAGHNGLKGHLGFFGGLAIQQAFNFGTTALAATGEVDLIQRQDLWDNAGVANGAAGDASKAVYFTPRFSGFQLGAAWIPDTGSSGFIAGHADNDGGWNNVLELGANYVGSFDSVKVTVAAIGAFADHDPAPNAVDEGDLDVVQVGARLDFSGFSVAAGYQDLGTSGVTAANQALGRDAGEWWSVGVGYQSGPWGMSVGYFSSEVSRGTGNAVNTRTGEVDWLNFGGTYAVAPGWTLLADLAMIDVTNINSTTTDQDGTAFVLSTQFAF
jgi:predicted porin